METSNRRIEVSTEVRNKIIKTFGVTGKTVSNALNYTGERGQTDLAKRIRIMALENGGRHMVSWPECETIHDANGFMHQIFDNGSKIEVDKQTGDARWFDPKGVKRGEQKNISIQQLYVMQELAASI